MLNNFLIIYIAILINRINISVLATNKHAIIRYQTLDNCFRNPGRKYFLEDLMEECNKAIYDFTGNPDGIKRRQIYDDITFMESEQMSWQTHFSFFFTASFTVKPLF